jgi:hypothetical protein
MSYLDVATLALPSVKLSLLLLGLLARGWLLSMIL